MSAHTPGPYFAGPDLENCADGRNITADVRGTRVRIAHTARVVHGGEEYVSPAEAAANAVLLAAAPLLAEALQAMLHADALEDVGEYADLTNVRRQARAALAAAGLQA